MSAPPLPAAVLFDMDGTLVDTEAVWVDGQYAVAAGHGVAWAPADEEWVRGRPLPDYAAELIARGATAQAKRQHTHNADAGALRKGQHIAFADGIERAILVQQTMAGFECREFQFRTVHQVIHLGYAIQIDRAIDFINGILRQLEILEQYLDDRFRTSLGDLQSHCRAEAAADQFRIHARKAWTPRTGSRVNRKAMTSAIIDSRDFLAARRRAAAELTATAHPRDPAR